MKTFKDIFDLYVSAASAVDLPRNSCQLFTTCEKQMEPVLVLLTPQQKELVMSDDKVMFICGGSGTGKTFVLKRRAMELGKKNDVMVINVSGGLLTEEFRNDFNDNPRIEVVDGREEDIEENLEKLKELLIKKGKGKHVLVDEVPLTLGFQGVQENLTPDAISDHWGFIVKMKDYIKTITLVFRPNDQSYSRDVPLQDIKPGGLSIKVLDRVKRNSRKIADLFLAIADYARRIFISRERTLPMDVEESEIKFLPVLFPVPSCFSLHPSKCKDELICRAVRASHAIKYIHKEFSTSSRKAPLLVVVDSDRMKAAMVNILTFIDHSPVSFFGEKGKFLGKLPPEGSFSLVVTDEEMLGCHVNNVKVILDFPNSIWKNFCRLITTTDDKKILIIEEEDWKTGKFSRLVKEIPGWDIKEVNFSEQGLIQKLETAWEEYKSNVIHHINEKSFPSGSCPKMDVKWDAGDEMEEVKNLLGSWIIGVFGYPGSGKSRRVDMFIQRELQLRVRVLILHCGSVLSQELYKQRWRTEKNVAIKPVPSNNIESLQDILNINELVVAAKRKGKVVGSMLVVIEDCPILKDMEEQINKVVDQFKKLKIKLVLVFKSHSRDDSGIPIEVIMRLLKSNANTIAVVLPSPPTDMKLLRHIYRNEAGTPLELQAKSLPTSSLPAAIIFGEPVLLINDINYKCPGRHVGYTCKGNPMCGPLAKEMHTTPSAQSIFVYSIAMEEVKKDSDEIYVLAADENLLACLRNFPRSSTERKIQFIHPKDFRGCEASIVISVNIPEDWMLEVISRSRTRLVIIDFLQEHREL
ncbi:unnamed protein product, partial [Darwinula stevensoni]